MANLSELLPTGGGQNAVDFVATGTLASGQTVALKADGTVEAVTGVAEGVGAESVFETSTTGYTASAFDSTNNKVVIAYKDEGNSSYGTAVVGTVSGTSISFGTPVVFETANSPYVAATFDSTANKVVIAYTDYGNSGYGTAIVGTVSGTSISFGSAVVFEAAANTQYNSVTFDSTSNKVVIAYQDVGNSSYGTAIVGTVSGTSISFGTAVVFNSTSTLWNSATFESATNKIVIAYRNAGNNGYGTSIVGTVSGTGISFGTAVVFENAASEEIQAVFDANANKIVIAYHDAGNSFYGTAIVGTLSGTSISFGTPVVFNAGNTIYIGATIDSTNNKVVIAYRDRANSEYGTTIAGTVSGTSISFDTAVVFNAATTNYVSVCFDSNVNKTVITYSDNGNSDYGTSVVLTVASTNLSATTFLGITSKAISSGATGAINTYGGINTAQTGLTIASDYYVQSDGSLSTASASPAIKVGQAVSATTINMKDLT